MRSIRGIFFVFAAICQLPISVMADERGPQVAVVAGPTKDSSGEAVLAQAARMERSTSFSALARSRTTPGPPTAVRPGTVPWQLWTAGRKSRGWSIPPGTWPWARAAGSTWRWAPTPGSSSSPRRSGASSTRASTRARRPSRRCGTSTRSRARASRWPPTTRATSPPAGSRTSSTPTSRTTTARRSGRTWRSTRGSTRATAARRVPPTARTAGWPCSIGRRRTTSGTCTSCSGTRRENETTRTRVGRTPWKIDGCPMTYYTVTPDRGGLRGGLAHEGEDLLRPPRRQGELVSAGGDQDAGEVRHADRHRSP